MPRKPLNRKSIEIDASGKAVGRLASEIARLLMGKHKAAYVPNADVGDSVRVKNADKMKLTGAKLEQKEYFHYSGYPGGMKVRKAGTMFAKNAGWILKQAVDRMLPKNTFRSRRLKRLTIVKQA
jgi:large subunit ribosomal protein L13